MNKSMAKSMSLSKWDITQDHFQKAFANVGSACGYCKLALINTMGTSEEKCDNCKKNFPEIYKVCDDLIEFFEHTETAVYEMIETIIDTIKKQAEDE